MPLTSVLDVLHEIGAKRFLLEIPPWVLRRRYVFCAVAPAEAVALKPSRIPFRLDPVLEENAHDLVFGRPGVYTLSRVRARLQQGHLAFVGRSRDAIVHTRWVFVGSVYLPYLSRPLVLAPGEGLLDEVYTVPAYRRSGLESAAAVEMRRVLSARGFRRIICAIAAWNRTPQRVAAAQGWAIVGSGGYWNLLGHKRFFWEGRVQDDRDGSLRVR